MATPESNVIGLTGDARIDGLLQGSAWQFGSGARVLTYSLNLNDTGIGGTWTSYPAIAAAVHQAFLEWTKVANVSFAFAGAGGVFNTSTADIAVTLTGNELQSAGFPIAALGIFPDPVFADAIRDIVEAEGLAYPNPEGDIFFDNFAPAYSHMNAGGVGLTYVLHEIGHALGLKHTDDDGGNNRPTFAALGIGALDGEGYTVMSTNTVNSAHVSSGNPATPMLLDILAIQSIYGANTSYNVGNNVYALSADEVLRTVWDAGGTDTFDASGNDSVGGVTIDLRPGETSFHGPFSRTTIAYGVVIENAVGSGASDTIRGNDANNRLDGGSGEAPHADTLIGFKGNDTYIVDSASDDIVEAANEGIDTAISSVSFTLPVNVENLTLSGSATINGTGNALDNVLIGNSAINTLTGGLGNDTYEVQSLDDVVVELAGQGSDTVRAPFSIGLASYTHIENVGLTGFNPVSATGNNSANVVSGNSADNTLFGLDGADTLFGLAGDDTLVGGLGDDFLNGGSGIDVGLYAGNRAAYNVSKAGTSATVTGPQGTDSLKSIDKLIFDDGTIDLIPLIRSSGIDQDGDRMGDLLWRNDTGVVAWWNMSGATLKTGSVMGTIPMDWTIVGTGDYNANGQVDILWRHDNGQLATWNTQGASYFGAVVADVTNDWTVLGSGNFDAANGTDILWRHDSGDLAVWLSNPGGAGFAGAHLAANLPPAWKLAGTGDFDGDLKTDLLWRHDDGNLAWWNMNGSAFAGGLIQNVPTNWQVEAVADFNGDHRADILWRDDAGQVGMWLMNGGSPLLQAGVRAPVPMEWEINATGDLNGDGNADIVWRHDDGTLGVWQMNGIDALQISVISAVPTDWFVT